MTASRRGRAAAIREPVDLLQHQLLHEENFDVRRCYQALGCALVRNRVLEGFTTVLLRKGDSEDR